MPQMSHGFPCSSDDGVHADMEAARPMLYSYMLPTMNTLGGRRGPPDPCAPDLTRPDVLPRAGFHTRVTMMWRLRREERDGDAVAAAREERPGRSERNEEGIRVWTDRASVVGFMQNF